jgi:hypothetical protein
MQGKLTGFVAATDLVRPLRASAWPSRRSQSPTRRTEIALRPARMGGTTFRGAIPPTRRIWTAMTTASPANRASRYGTARYAT